MQKKWAQIQSILETRIDSGQVKAWIASLVPVREEKGLVLCTQTEFAAAHVRRWYAALLDDAVRQVLGPECPVRVECRPGCKRDMTPAVAAGSAAVCCATPTAGTEPGPVSASPHLQGGRVDATAAPSKSGDLRIISSNSGEVRAIPPDSRAFRTGWSGPAQAGGEARPVPVSGARLSARSGGALGAGAETHAVLEVLQRSLTDPAGREPAGRARAAEAIPPSGLDQPGRAWSAGAEPPSEREPLPDAGSCAPAPRLAPSPRPLPQRQLLLPEALAEPAASCAAQSWRYSFDDFVVGPCNEMAYAASRSMCGDVRQADILFLSSAPGLGKTHLMHAVGQVLTASCNRRRPQVAYLTAEEFTTRFYMSIKGQDTDRFKARYRNLDLLLLEDAHFLQGKEKTQAELLSTIKALTDRGSKVVFSSSFAPRDMRQMDDQLHSRLSAGLVTFIDRPDEETRRKILRRKAGFHQVLLPDDVEAVLARHIHADVRQIESCLCNLILKAKLLNSRITLQMAWDVLSQYASHSPILDMESIIRYICQGFEVSREQLLSSSRKQEYVCARNSAFFLARKHTDLSLENIGRHFNRRHSTVLKGITSLEREISRQSPRGRQIANTLAMIERNGNIVPPANA